MARTRRPALLSPIALVRRNGLYKGLLGGDRQWLVIGGVFWGARFLKKSFGKNEEVVTIERMEPGQWMSLRTIPPPTRAERKADKRSAKAAKRSAVTRR
jgi:hypothetical protein